MKVGAEVLSVLEAVLNLKGRSVTFEQSTPLLGSVPELDSMAVVSIIAALEDKFAFTIDDDEIDGSIFATVGSLVGFVERKLSA
jgi:acyl carrier protein